jgi:hypothetical protein
MGSGDPSGLQNRRELALLALVSSTLTRFRHEFLRLRACGASLRISPGGSRCAHAAKTAQLQNRRELALQKEILRFAQDFGSRLPLRSRLLSASSSTLTRFRHCPHASLNSLGQLIRSQKSCCVFGGPQQLWDKLEPANCQPSRWGRGRGGNRHKHDRRKARRGKGYGSFNVRIARRRGR